MLVLSFLLLVLLPSAVWGWYLWNRAADQYTSTVGFSVRREEGAAPIDMFGGIFGGTAWLCCTNLLMAGVPLSPDRPIPRPL